MERYLDNFARLFDRGLTYSQRSADIGSTFEARRAGKAHAMPATAMSTRLALAKMTGSRELPSAHVAKILFKPSVRPRPARMPLPKLTSIEANTIHRICSRCAPSAMRMPNSLVRWVTAYDTTL